MNDFLQFFSFSDPNVRLVVLGTALIGACSGSIGTFMVLTRKSLLGDVISHSILPGICVAFILYPVRSGIHLFIGAMVAGLLSGIAADYFSRKSVLRPDALFALVLSVFFGLGVMLITYIQQNYGAGQAGLDAILFGTPAAINQDDLTYITVVAAVIFACLILFFRSFRMITFNAGFAQSIGVRVRIYNGILSSLTVMAVAIGIQAVGVVLMAALLIAPSIVSKALSNRLWLILLISAFVGGLSGLLGSFVSYTLPAMPTGPWIVICLSLMVFAVLPFRRKFGNS